MSYDSEKIIFGKEHINIVEIDADFCDLTFGVLPCTASGSGDQKCYNCLETCQDVENFDLITKTYRFCEPRSSHPIGLQAIPILLNVSVTPAKIDLGGGLGVRASINCSFTDAPHSDIDIDPYVNERTYDPFLRGSFWTKWRARNPNYQFRDMRAISGYLVNGVYDAANFQTRHYVTETINVSAGRCSATGKDPLKLASKKKAQAPAPSNGLLQSALTDVVTTATLIPAGIGNAEYPASGFVAIKSEVMSFTRVADVLTIVRGEKNTLAIEHAANDTVQLCLVYGGAVTGQLDFIITDLLTNFANIDISFINAAAWDAEVGTFLSGLLETIITKPFDVWKLLKELSEAMPHYLWWDERQQTIQLTALKAPPIGADVLDMDGNLVEDSFTTMDKPDMRVSTVFVNFGQFDPTQRLDEPNNYQQTYARIDTDSITKYGSSEIKVINSRWISNTNKASALQTSALIGRRFSNTPREIRFELDAKDSDVWVGQTRDINHRDIVDFSGLPIDTTFQIMSSSERENYSYTALEFTYGESLPEDEGGGDPAVDLILLSIDSTNINLRTVYDSLFPAPDGTTQAKFIIEDGIKIGSTSNASYGLVTGSWPAGAIITLQINPGGFSLGKGGDATTGNGDNGGHAIRLDYDLTLVNNGIIGGGGGGGASDNTSAGPDFYRAGGGGGAGFNIGLGQSSSSTDPGLLTIDGVNGTTENGGVGGSVFGVAAGADAGDLGQNGSNSSSHTGGTAGDAINKNGFVLTETVTGDIRGNVIA